MIYGPSYSGTIRECEACGHFTSVHSDCSTCTKSICENCALHGDCTADFCSDTCKQEACEHENVRYELYDDVDIDAGYCNYRETWTCRDCGAELEGHDDYTVKTRRAA